MEQDCDLLFLHGHVITMDDQDRIIDNGAVAVRGTRIAAVGPCAELAHWRAKRSIDCRGTAVLPGLIDCHNHLFQVAGRGLGDGMALWQWLGEFMLPLAANIDACEALAAVRLGAFEALSCGTTTVVDNHYAPADVQTTLAVAGALRDLGLRGVVARGMFGPFTKVARDNGLNDALFRHDTAHELASMRECLQHWKDECVAIWPSPINVIYNDPALVQGAAQLAREFDVKWHTHCSEARIDPMVYEQAYGSRPITWLERHGLLDERATFAHAIWLDDAEVQALGQYRCAVAHNPMSNAYLASGAMRLRDLRNANATVGIGADGAAGHSMDLFQIMRQIVYTQRLATLDPVTTRAYEALALATREGARFVGVQAGQLQQGKLADIAVVSLDTPALAPCFDIAANLVYGGSGRDVKLTVVNGRIVYEDRNLTLVDGLQIIHEARRLLKPLIERLGLSHGSQIQT